MLGRLEKYKPRAKKFQFDVLWKAGCVVQQQVKLENYFLGDSGEIPIAGNWFYIQTSRSRRPATAAPTPATGNDDNDDDIGAGDEEDGASASATPPSRARARVE